MSTITITEELTIDRPAEQVWAVLGDYRRDPDWRTGVITMTIDADPPRAGAQTVEQLEFGGRTYRNVGELTEVEPRAISWHTVAGARAHGSRSVRPLENGGCVARLELVVAPTGAQRVLAPVLGRMLRRNTRADLHRLAALAGPTTVSAGPSDARADARRDVKPVDRASR
jgi:uncharacterized membrane protein